MMKFSLPIAAAALAALLAASPAEASSPTTPSSSGAHVVHAGPGGVRTPLPAVHPHVVRIICRTAACRAKHPGGSYIEEIRPQSSRAGAA